MTSNLVFVHNIASADGLPLNLLINGQVVRENVVYGTITSFIPITEGPTVLAIQIVTTRQLVQLNANIVGGRSYLLIAVGQFNNQDEFPLQLRLYSNSQFTEKCQSVLQFINGAAGFPRVDLILNDRIIFANVSYSSFAIPLPISVAPITYRLRVVVTGTSIVLAGPFNITLSPNQLTTVITTGIPENGDTSPNIIVVSVPLRNQLCNRKQNR